MKEKLLSEKQIRSRAIFAFVFFLITISAGVFAWVWLRKQPGDSGLLGGIPKVLRKGLTANEKLFSTTYSSSNLAKTYPKSSAVRNVTLKVRSDHEPAIGFIARVKCGSGVLDRLRVQALSPSSAGTERHLAPF